jgi:hypothetical protein
MTLRRQEMWAAHLIRCALPGVGVKCHDDGSQPAMYDLDLLRESVPFGASEVTATVDAASMELHWRHYCIERSRVVGTGNSPVRNGA